MSNIKNYNKNIFESIKHIDEFALNKMIDKKIYNKILEDYDNKDNIAKENKIPLCFLY